MLTEERKKERMAGIGGSEAAASVGLSKYQQPLGLYLIKTGEVEPPNLDDVERVHFGNVLEDVVGQEYMRREGKKVRRVNRHLAHKKYPWMLANIDRDVVGEKRGLEIKTADKWAAADFGEPGTDEVPQEYLIQCNHYMAVLDYPVWDLAVLIGGNEYRRYEIPRDEEFIEGLIEAEHNFWQHVLSKTPPDPDFDHASTDKLFSKIYEGNGETITLGDDAARWQAVREEAEKEIKVYQSVVDGAKRHLQHLVGNNSIGVLPDGREFRREIVKRKGYTVEDTQYTQFKLVKPRKK